MSNPTCETFPPDEGRDSCECCRSCQSLRELFTMRVMRGQYEHFLAKGISCNPDRPCRYCRQCSGDSVIVTELLSDPRFS